jgi:hypothetical protein
MRFRSSRGIIPVALVLFIAACGTIDPELGVTGTWSMSYTDGATGCGEGVTMGTVSLAILQTGNTLVVTAGGIVLTGSINGAEGTWGGSYPEDGGTTTEQFTVTFTNNETRFNGGSTWTWADNIGGCAGSSTGSK